SPFISVSIFFQAEDGIRDKLVTGVQTCALPILWAHERHEGLSAIITLTDRLVTSALALETLPDLPQKSRLHERLLNVADGCERKIGRASCRERVEVEGVGVEDRRTYRLGKLIEA